MATSGSRDFISTRNSLIKTALRKVGAIAQGDEPTPEQLSEAAEALNTLVLSLQIRKVFLWTQEDDIQILYSGIASYIIDLDIIDLTNVFFRVDDTDSPFLDSITRESYKQLVSKKQSGLPTKYYLDKQLSANKIYLWSVPENNTSVVVGTDSNNYLCIKSHTSDSTNKPITGADYTTYWEQTTENAVAWATGTLYYSDVLHFTKILRLQDFDTEADNPDFPVRWYRALIYGLAFELSHEYTLPLDERKELFTIFEREFQFAKESDNDSSNLYVGIRR